MERKGCAVVKSMTGYGRGEHTRNEWKFIAEIKAVNHRYCDISIKMPSVMNPFEDRIRKLLARDIKRGKVDVYVRLESYGQQNVKIHTNVQVAEAYAKALYSLQDRYHVSDGLSLQLLASLPEVFTIDKSVEHEEELGYRMWEVLEPAIESAAKNFNDMRQVEGRNLLGDILSKRKDVLEIMKEIKTRAPLVALEHEKRLRERIAEVLRLAPEAGFEERDENRILLELALYADRIAIDEEIARIESHIEQLSYFLTEKDSVGRKLDFLVQELNREANTIASKANDKELAKLVIEMKSKIEKIREQVQNVE